MKSALAVNRPVLSQSLIKAFNFHAITCLHVNAGEYRPCKVYIGNSDHKPPDHYRVQALMDDFVNQVNAYYGSSNFDPVYLAAYALWRLNWIHPFINGNGRTARITAYYLLCIAFGGLLLGAPILPELIRQNRDGYVAGLKEADESLNQGHPPNLESLHKLISDLLTEQISASANILSNPG